MQNQPTKENKMGTMPINRLLLSMSVPMMISMLIQALYNVVDSIFVAKISENALVAVSLAFPMQNLMISVAVGTGVGINALLSRSLGEGNRDVANKTANNGIFLAILSYLVFLVIGIFGVSIFYRAQTNIPDIIENGTAYLTICCAASFGLFGQIACERLLQSTGRSVYAMITQGVGAIINIVLDPILIFGLFGMPQMGVAGAAVATVLGQMVSMVMGLYLNIRKNHDIQLHPRLMKPEGQIIKKIYQVGVPSIVMASISSVTTFCMNKILFTFSSTATAVFSAYFKLQSFVFMPVFGLNNGLVPIIAYNYGARQKERILQTIKLGSIYAIAIMAAGMAAFLLVPDKLLLFFSASETMLTLGIPALRILSLAFVFAGFNIVCSSAFQALGHGMYSLTTAVARQLLVLIPLAFLLSLTGVLDAVWLSYPLAEVVCLLLSILLLRKSLKRLTF